MTPATGPRRPSPRIRLVAAALAAALAVVSCGTDEPGTSEAAPETSAPATTPAAEPGDASEAAVPPLGVVVPTGNAPEGIVVGTSGIAAIAVRNPDGIDLVDATTGASIRTVSTDGAARHLSLAGPDGPVLAPLEGSDELIELGFDGTVVSTAMGVGRQPHDAIAAADGTIVATNEMGGGVVFLRDGEVLESLPAGPVQPGGVAAVGNYAAVADVQGNGVWVYDATTRTEVATAPVGVKLTHAIGLGSGLAAFADTDGGAVLIERIDPQVTEVSRIDAPGNPYGMAHDPAKNRLYITLTASNVLRVIDIADPAQPRIVGDIPTVRQPNSVAVDPRSGAVLITGSDPDGDSGLQIVTPDLLPA